MNQSDDQQFTLENAPDTESLADLALSDAQAEATKGGTLGQPVTFTATVNPSAAITPFGSSFNGGVRVAG